MKVTYGTDTLAFMGIEVKESLMIPVRKFCKAFGHTIFQFRTRRVDNDLSFEEWERLYTSLSVRPKGVKDRMEVVMTAAESFESNETEGGRESGRGRQRT